MEHFARWVVRHRKAVLAAAVLLLIPSVFGAAGTYINYDILTYLPPELDSMVGEGYLEDDFNMASTSMITVENMSTADTLALKSELEAVAGVKSVLWTSDILDVTTPKEMLPADIQKFFYSENGATLLLVQFENPSAHAVTMQAQRTIKDILRKDCFIGGMSAILEDTKSLVNQEMPVYILCAVGACLVVLFLSMKETVVPLIFMLGMVFPIVYNFGTNIFLGQISYITEALATVLQLGVTMDFSIFLLHRFEEEKRSCPDEDEAMVRAVQKTFSSILASSLTTIAGFLAMCTMRLTLGRDIGIVMAKGVLLGVVSTVTILPALILTFRRSIARHTHRTFIPLRRTPPCGAGIFHPRSVRSASFHSAWRRRKRLYTTHYSTACRRTSRGFRYQPPEEDFGMTTSHFICVDDGLPARDMEALTDEIEQVDGIRQVLSL
ncbi:MAG: MMPL family transporter [Ruthenibacterium lactatiformans]